MRLSQAFCGSELIDFVAAIAYLHGNFKQKLQKGIIFIVFAFFLVLILGVVLVELWLEDATLSMGQNFKLTVYPSSDKFVRIACMTSNLIACTNLMHAYLFVTLFGVLILNIFENLTAKFDINILRRQRSTIVEIASGEHEVIDEFMKEIFALKHAMGTYSKIAGIYCLAMLYHASGNFIRFLHYVTSKDKVAFILNSMFLNVFCLLAIGFTSWFGNYLGKRFNQIKEKLLMANVETAFPREEK
ncbi:unnamed protein product, partial [Allacma fusca]